MSLALKILLALAVLLIFALLTAAVILFRFAFCRKPPKLGSAALSSAPVYDLGELFSAADRFLASAPREPVEIRSFDGLTLRGVFIPAKDAVRTVLCAHGYRGSAPHDFAGAMEWLSGQGCNLLLIDQRAQNTSEGRYLTFGALERFDIRDWAVFLAARLGPDHPIYLDGISMGASSVLMAAGLELPDSVRGVIADCGFTSPWEQFVYILKRYYRLPVWPLLNICELLARLFAGFDFRSASTLEALSHCKLPVLLAHGLSDSFVPPYMSEQSYAACASGWKRLILAEKAEHGMSFLLEPERYRAALFELFALDERP